MDGEIDAATLREYLSDGDVRIVDIRSPAQFRRGHIPDSVNVPFGELPDRVAELTGADRIVTVCPHGKASVQAAELIGAYEGVDDETVVSLSCGIEGWDGDLASGDDGSDDSGTNGGVEERPDAPF